MRFRDRIHAGQVLASMLKELAGRDCVVMAVPNGGVPVGAQMAAALGAELGVVIVRKLQIPGNTEAGFGAVTSRGDIILNQLLVKCLRLGKDDVQRIAHEAMLEIRRRQQLFHPKTAGESSFGENAASGPRLRGRTVILTDDGLASGFTMMAAARSVRRQEPKRLLVAVPTASAEAAERVAGVVQRLVCPDIRRGPVFAVADAYEDWYDLDTEEAAGIFREHVGGHHGASGKTG